VRPSDALDAIRFAVAPNDDDEVWVWYNVDVTPFAKRRDAAVRAWCAQAGNAVARECEDYSLYPRGAVLNGAGRAYRVFTPFQRRCAGMPPPRAPDRGLVGATTFRTLPARETAATVPPDPPNADSVLPPIRSSRVAALRVLRRIRRGDGAFDGDRRCPCLPTTRLSVALKFGTISAREFHAAALVAGSAVLVRQMLWREFHFHLFDDNPSYLGAQLPRGTSAPSASEPLWSEQGSAQAAAAWRAGQTGVRIVDDAMRRLRETGYLHNRERLVVATFLVFDLGVNWRVGEHHFATQLADYDPVQNSANWRAVAATPRFKRLRHAAQERVMARACRRKICVE
jgi:deoxyribodipyrimidine photo-lyase